MELSLPAPLFPPSNVTHWSNPGPIPAYLYPEWPSGTHFSQLESFSQSKHRSLAHQAGYFDHMQLSHWPEDIVKATETPQWAEPAMGGSHWAGPDDVMNMQRDDWLPLALEQRATSPKSTHKATKAKVYTYGNWTRKSNITGLTLTQSSVPPTNQTELQTKAPESTKIGYSIWEQVIIAVLASFLSILTVSGNLLVMISFKIDKQLQTITNYFLFSLAIADFVIGLISMPLFTIMGRWPLGPFICDTWLALDYISFLKYDFI